MIPFTGLGPKHSQRISGSIQLYDGAYFFLYRPCSMPLFLLFSTELKNSVFHSEALILCRRKAEIQL